MFGLTPAPEIDRPDLEWLNVASPLSLRDLRGRLVILDFFTPCCVNCLHVQPTLRRLRDVFAGEVVVISVNAPKFPAERSRDCLIHAIARLGITHPVIHDPELALWRAYGVQAWPTLVLIDPRGQVLGQMQGEPCAERLISGVGEMLRQWRRDGSISGPAAVPLSLQPCGAGQLRFPGKVKALRREGHPQRWAVADSGHHQIVVLDDTGRERWRFGCGEAGLIDTDVAGSAFNSPQGLVCAGHYIFVADTGNHAIRRIDLDTGAVVTLAGTGERGPVLRSPRPARDVQLASVWDLELCAGQLFFANAGTHQIGVLDLDSAVVSPLAGCGTEDLMDGAAPEASLAQPSGLALDPDCSALYFTDSETSAVRRVRLGQAAAVETIVGTGLFEFGSRNGAFGEARLQHCLGLTWWNEGLAVADTYNGAIRWIDLQGACVRGLETPERPAGLPAALTGGEPAGIAADGPERLLVADTNHHRILELIIPDCSTRIWAA
jgi:thiol-disulfide isomerase/thioredoxin